ncbi:MAG TPA: BTAD domain-containing putative transcriptional regulator [Streptosporangiaceae bacterium]|nr:BTAD domain-containing putative transcriptional regulator [Streptosporangiaceae bacterium]
MRFQVLGPLEVWTGDDWASIGAPKWRSLLAALLVNAGQVVSTDRLITEIWSDEPPRGATNLVAVYALKLRRMLGDDDGKLLRHRAPGYLLAVEPEDVDSLRFGALVASGRRALATQQPERAAALLTEALGLWRGRPYMDARASDLVDAEVERLEAAQLDALELSFEAGLGCGQHAEVTPELFRLTADHPLREGLWGLLMRALDAAGRHAEALAAYARAREMIADELGVDPGEALQSLYEEILTEEAAPHPVVASSPPMQLPADIADFTGRGEDVDRLCELVPDEAGDGGAVKIAAVTGAGGLGKTTLAVHVAHRLRPHFPDGQVYVNLLGASPQPLAPGDVLARFLRELGVGGAQIPVDEAERAGLLRTRLTGRRILMLLDDARDAAQVRPLLPGSASCTVIVTTRNRLPDLPVTRLVDLNVLGGKEARALFTSIVGIGRANAEAAATDEVLTACAGLPLAIRIAGARLAARQSWTVAAMASRLHSEQRRLDELKAGDLAVRATFEVSFASLPRPVSTDRIDPARAFRLLGLWQGPAISLPAAAALFGQSDDNAADALEALVDAHLLESPAPDAYRFHDLLRVYAAERSQAEPEQIRRDAVRRILTWYLHTAEAAARVISPNNTRVPLGAAEPEVRPLAFASLEEALGWCEDERASLAAATGQASASGMHDIGWQLPAATGSFYYRRSHWADWEATHQIGLASARRLCDRPGEARMLHNLGMAYALQHRTQTITYFEQAVVIFREIGDREGAARAATGLATACFYLGHFRDALDASQRSLVLQREAGNRHGEGIALGDLGCACRELGLHDEAIVHHEQALAIFGELGDRDNESDSLSELASVYLRMGRVAEALDRLVESLAIRRDIGDRHGQALTLNLLGEALRRGGRPAEAVGPMTEAMRIFEELGDGEQAAEIRSGLATLTQPDGGGDTAEADRIDLVVAYPDM